MGTTDKIPKLIGGIYSIVRELESLFPRKFTPDGHLVGSIGEVLAANDYGLTLLPASVKTHDAKTSDGKMVQIKATQGKSVAFRSEPSYLIVLHINKNGTHDEIYNGPGNIPWNQCGKIQSNGQRSISLNRLRKLNVEVKEEHRLPRKNVMNIGAS